MDITYKNKVTYLSFFLALLVVFRHTINVEIYGLDGGILYAIQIFVRELTDLCVPTFFALSGYLFFQNYDRTKLLSKWRSRFFSVAVPYLVWNLIAFLYYQLIFMIPFVRDAMNGDVLPISLGTVAEAILMGTYNITWFLRNLMAYIVVVPLLFPVLRRKMAGILLIAAVFLLSLLENDAYGLLSNGLFYLAGAYLGIHFRDDVQRRYSGKYVAAASAVLLLSVVAGAMFPAESIGIHGLIRLVQVGLIWLTAEIVATEKTPKWWMTISFVIYCSHSFLLESVEKVFLILFGKNQFGATVDFFLAPLITVGLITLAAGICRKVKPLWTILSGNR